MPWPLFYPELLASREPLWSQVFGLFLTFSLLTTSSVINVSQFPSKPSGSRVLPLDVVLFWNVAILGRCFVFPSCSVRPCSHTRPLVCASFTLSPHPNAYHSLTTKRTNPMPALTVMLLTAASPKKMTSNILWWSYFVAWRTCQRIDNKHVKKIVVIKRMRWALMIPKDEHFLI